jgi:hypothetical protein
MEDSEEQVRDTQKALRDLDQGADKMERNTSQLDSKIDSVRQEFERRRNDENVPGLPPEPNVDEDQAGGERPDESPEG